MQNDVKLFTERTLEIECKCIKERTIKEYGMEVKIAL